LNVLIVSGIWPPDVGGPASHAPELAGFLHARGHTVEVVTTADSAPQQELYAVHWASRRLPVGVRHLRCAFLIRAIAARSDVVYATSMLTRAALGAQIARRPLVVKLATDPAHERAARRGLFAGDPDAFQHYDGGVRVAALRKARDASVQRAAHVFCPSAYLRGLAIGWGVRPERVSVIPNPAPVLDDLAPRDELRAALGLDGPTLVFAGRLGPQKTLEVALEAVARVDGVTLLLAGDGPERPALEARAHQLGLDTRARFLGPQSRARVLELFRAADASALSSAYENFPHGVVESLAVGTPVIATDVGGVAEVLRDGENGLLVPPGDPGALADAVRRFFADERLRRRLAAAAAPSVAEYAPERLLGRIESALVDAGRSAGSGAH
jgi:glycosyltransferase involved in cell wall biosynthesis